MEISDIADRIELRVWATGMPYTLSSIKEELQAVMDDEEEPSPEDCAQGVLDEILSRQVLLGGAYPFECDGYKVKFSAPAAGTPTYIFCLGLTVLPATEIANEQREQQFETIAMTAAKSFFGGDDLRIGAPWRTHEITTYAALLDKVIELVPDLGPRSRDTAPDGGDCGWDVLIVKGFKDRKFPRLIVLGNCATGKTDCMKKGMETSPDYFFVSSFNSAHRGVLITFFAVPFVMDDDDRMRKLYGQTVTFDRFRICEHSPISPVDVGPWLDSKRPAALLIALN